MNDLATFSLFPTLIHYAQSNPERVAIVTPDIRINYGDLPQRVLAVAGSLLEQGLDVDAMTAVTIPEEVQHLLVTLALLCLGTPNISLGSFDEPATHQRIADILGISQLIAPSYQRDHLAGMDNVRHFWPESSHVPAENTASYLSGQQLQPDHKVIYRSTSGTTGVPKSFGCTMAHIMNMTAWVAGDPAKACILRTSSMEHDSSRVQQACSLLAGRTAAILHPVSAANLAPFCASAGVTEIHGGTFRLASLLASPPDPKHRLPDGTRFLTGGSRVPGALRAAAMERLTTELYVSFATSEVSAISVAGPEEHAAWPEGVGYPRPGIDIELRDAENHPVARGEVGELWVRRPGVPGDGTASNPGWVTTGDLLSWPDGGPLVFHARKDDMMIMNGINIFPGPIEDNLSTHPAVAEVVAYPVPSGVHGQIPVAAVVLKPGVTVNSTELIRHARSKLGLQAPRQVQIVDRIPRTTLGKPRTLELRGVRATG